MKRRLLCVVMVVAMALCLAACGGSDSKMRRLHLRGQLSK